MLQFEDPFERVLSYVAETYGITAFIRFVDPSEFRSRLGFFGLRRPKGETFWPDDGGPPEIALSARLKRGVSGTLDILAHELAHVVAGPEAEHGPEWQRVYQAIFEACCDQPTVTRKFPTRMG